MIRVTIPAHLRTLARVEGELEFDLDPPVTQDDLLTALEDRFPMLKGTIRDHVTKKRRPFIRFFACEQDLSHESGENLLSERVLSGEEPFMVVGGIAGG